MENKVAHFACTSMKRFLSLLLFVAISGSYVWAQADHSGHDHSHDSHSEHGHSHDSHAAPHGDAHGAGQHGAHPDIEDPIPNVIMHHVMDSHDWHITSVGETHIELPLPWILYNTKTGLDFFLTGHGMESDPHYVEEHGHAYYVKSKTPIFDQVLIMEKDQIQHGLHEKVGDWEKESDSYVVLHHPGNVVDEAGNKTKVDHVKVYEKVEGAEVYDFSLTKTGLHILLMAILMIFVFRAVAKGYKKNRGKAPKGIQSLLEPVILFVREDIARPYLHGKHDKFVPYLLTLFFFIWFSNMFGLTPLSSNIAGNTSITLMLALLSFILILANSTKDFWGHIFWFPGVPLPVKLLMMVVEFLGLLTKPAALAIRLFANISAGHFMTLALICLIFILGDNGRSVAGAVGIMPLSIIFALFIFLVEVIVAAVQAFVFAMLTAVFIGQAMETHDDH